MNVFIRTIEVIVIKKVLPNNKKNLKEEKKDEVIKQNFIGYYSIHEVC